MVREFYQIKKYQIKKDIKNINILKIINIKNILLIFPFGNLCLNHFFHKIYFFRIRCDLKNEIRRVYLRIEVIV